MKKNLFLTFCLGFYIMQLFSQANCTNPKKINICPPAVLLNQTNASMGDDAPSGCNIAGEDVVYEISAPNGAQHIYISISNASAAMKLFLEETSCGTGICNSTFLAAGNSNFTFTVNSAAYYYLWVDAVSTITYDISVGGDTGSVFVNIPNTQGNLQFDSSFCSLPVFQTSKPFFQVLYNGIYRTNPMTLAPLFVTGTLCSATFFENTTGIEGVKEFDFEFNPAGYSSVIAPDSVPGFYNPGWWVRFGTAFYPGYKFFDAAGTGKGDFTGTPNSCLQYEFCFDVVPVSNSYLLTDVKVAILSDGFGAGYSGFVNLGCCPSAQSNCLGTAGSGVGAAHGFGYGFADPGSPLPVELTTFIVLEEHNKVFVRWITASETNNDYFTVEKSTDCKHWMESAEMKGAGNSVVITSYELVDEHPFYETSYYRLKQTDFNGRYSYSSVRKIYISKTELISVYPNPFNESLNIVTGNDEINELTLFDIASRKILQQQFTHSFSLNTRQLSKGIYFYELRNISESCRNGIIKKEKIVKE